jgi:SNF2 family DNA or RNA helicase
LVLDDGSTVAVPKNLQLKAGSWRIVAMTTLVGLLSELKRKAAPRAVFDALNKHDMLVVYTQRVASAKMLAADIRRMDTTGSIEVFGPISGETDHDQRLELASQFASLRGTGRRAVFVATLGSAGISLNQLAAAQAALFSDLWWRPCDLLQAEGRVLRIGQTSNLVEFYYLVIPNTLDDHILSLLDMKARSASEISPNDTEGLCLSADLSPESAINGESDLDAVCAALAPLLEAA